MNTAGNPGHRLRNEKSPYLLQHAHNPVDWFPWCDEAFETAAREDKPVFLSIGYSTCHWCHVMAHESFEDDEIAALLNEHFVPIKVDREERPDVDHVYMTACVAANGSGGWPLSAFLTPDRLPFFTGTYFPKDDRGQQMGFRSLVDRVAALWQHDRAALQDAAKSLRPYLDEDSAAGDLPKGVSAQAAKTLLRRFDARWGGFGQAPKFPSPHTLTFLMRSAADAPIDDPHWVAVRRTLDGILEGGIRDHVGGGFCRYATDEKWLVPHFEKMLYDNALLVAALCEAHEKQPEERYADAVGEAIAWMRSMQGEDGGFSTAQDADSEGQEGKYYVWTPGEIQSVLGKDAARYMAIYGITERGNFEGRNIPNRMGRGFAAEDRDFCASANAKLLAARELRVPPLTDDKRLLSSNALAIAALAVAGRVLHREDAVEMATRAMHYIEGNLMRESGLRGSHTTDAEATLDGAAYLVWAYIELFVTTQQTKWLESALVQSQALLVRYGDGSGGLYFTAAGESDLPVRPRNSQDGAVPSGHAIAAQSFARLSHYCADAGFEDQARAIIASQAELVPQMPTAFCGLLQAQLELDAHGVDLVVTRGEGFDALWNCLQGYRPFAYAVAADPDDPAWEELNPSISGMKNADGKAAAYLCQHQTCSAPVREPEALGDLLASQTSIPTR